MKSLIRFPVLSGTLENFSVKDSRIPRLLNGNAVDTPGIRAPRAQTLPGSRGGRGWLPAAALQRLGVRPGDRVAYVAPNTHAQLESFYAVPQLGAVTVPINRRLAAADFAYILGHSDARVVCAHPDHLDTLDRIRGQVQVRVKLRALEGSKDFAKVVVMNSQVATQPGGDQQTFELSLIYTRV